MGQLAVDQETGELVRDARGSLVRVSGNAEIVQWNSTRLRLHQGEMPLRSEDGTRYRGFILEKGTPEALIKGHLRDRVAGTPGVVSIGKFELDGPDPDTRAITLTYDAMISVDDLAERSPIADTLTIVRV